MNSIKDAVIEVIKEWNAQVKVKGIEVEYILDVKCRKKKFYTNKKDFYEKSIAEIKLIHKGTPTILLWSLETDLPTKVKGMTKVQIENDVIQNLYKTFLYECIGLFCVTTKTLQDNKDMAEYDIENDRLKQDDSAIGMVISALEEGPFYNIGDEFDVFIQTDEYYGVYTQHDIGLKNNGIARVEKSKFLVKENAKQKIILL